MNEILINVLFLLLVLLITQNILESNSKRLTDKTISIYIFLIGLLSIFLCMTFPLPVSEGFIIDIRIVPFIIASLYGGPVVSLGLFLFIVCYRFLIGFDLGFMGTTLNYMFVPVLTLFVHKRFKQFETYYKILLAITMVTFHLLTGHIIYTTIFVSNTSSTVILVGGIIKILCVIIFIWTIERIKLSYQMRRKIADIEKMEIISHLSASISHEVRNGLTGAKGFMQLLKEMEGDLQKQKYIQIALDELERSEGIIRDFLTFAKPAPEKIEKINLEEVIEKTIELVRPLANMNSVEIQKSLFPIGLYGEVRIIKQAFLNILKNAVEAMPDGGQLMIIMNHNQNMYEISIKDTGIGMEQEQIDRLGKPYFTTKGQKGTGLGLMVAYRVIEELNGKIKVTSQPGEGTVFTISIPQSAHMNEEILPAENVTKADFS